MQPRFQDENSEVKPLTKDIQAILTVMGRRLRTYGKGEDQPLDLDNVQLRSADLRDADLNGAHLRDAQNLTQEQANSARGDGDTQLPPGIVMPESWN